eukprot:365689-Chlamydomonas_euryale.AAC.5
MNRPPLKNLFSAPFPPQPPPKALLPNSFSPTLLPGPGPSKTLSAQRPCARGAPPRHHHRHRAALTLVVCKVNVSTDPDHGRLARPALQRDVGDRRVRGEHDGADLQSRHSTMLLSLLLSWPPCFTRPERLMHLFVVKIGPTVHAGPPQKGGGVSMSARAGRFTVGASAELKSLTASLHRKSTRLCLWFPTQHLAADGALHSPPPRHVLCWKKDRVSTKATKQLTKQRTAVPNTHMPHVPTSHPLTSTTSSPNGTTGSVNDAWTKKRGSMMVGSSRMLNTACSHIQTKRGSGSSGGSSEGMQEGQWKLRWEAQTCWWAPPQCSTPPVRTAPVCGGERDSGQWEGVGFEGDVFGLLHNM